MKFSIVMLSLFIIGSLKSQSRYDVVIDEIMIDPSPSVGLPNYEWVEIKNTSSNSINLRGWRLIDEDGQSGAFPNYELKPDSFLIICGSTGLSSMQEFGNAIGVPSFPSLDNGAGLLAIATADGSTLYSMTYSEKWYANDLKKEGGWTLEMIDPAHPCDGMKNWKASIADKGGSPGKINSIDSIILGYDPTSLLNTWFSDSMHIIIQFDKQVDSASSLNLANYFAEAGLRFTRVEELIPSLDKVQLSIASSIEVNKVYTITINGIKDCADNQMSEPEMIKIGKPSDPIEGDYIINEILFDPRPGCYDFIELYNKGQKIIDASRLFVANRNTSGAINSIKALTDHPQYIFPGDYIVVTEDLSSLQRNYLVQIPLQVFEISSLPSFPDDEGDVVILNFKGTVVDELRYSKDWHFKLITNAEGVSLERIDALSATQDASNWHSSSSTAGYATPTYKNSQHKNIEEAAGKFDTQPKTFSPDGDGYNDIATISYVMKEPGYVVNISIFDALGRPVKVLVANALLGITGHWNWDGLDDKGAKLPTGVYIILTELFNLQGKKDRFKNAVILARRLK